MSIRVLNLPKVQLPYLRVGFLTPSLNMGGAERWFLTLIKNFRSVRATALGFVGNVCSEFIAAEAERACPLFTHSSIGYGTNLGSVAAVIGRVFSESDVVLTWGIEQTMELFQGFKDKPIIDVSHNERDFPDQARLCQQSWRGCNFVAGVSGSSVEAYPVAVQPMAHAIHNGAEVDRATPRRTRADLRELYQYAPDDKVMLFMGRFANQKHPEILARALAKLPANYQAAFVGRGELYSDLKRWGEDFAGNRIKIFSSTPQVGDFLEMSDVFCLPSDYEGHPIAVCEAWLSGIPTVLTNLGYVKELEGTFQAELCYKIERPVVLADFIEAVQLAANNGREHAIPRRARAIAWQYLTAAAMAYRWETFLIWVSHTWQDYMLRLPAEATDNPPALVDLIRA